MVGSDQFITVHLDAPAELAESRNESARKLTEDDAKESEVAYQAPTDADLVLNRIHSSGRLHHQSDRVARIAEADLAAGLRLSGCFRNAGETTS